MPVGNADTTADAGTAIDPYPLEVATGAERQLFALFNGERERAGLPGLSWNGNVAVVAREQSVSARDGGDVDLESMMRTRIPMVGAANFAKAEAVTDAHAAFMENSNQRANVLSNKFNQVGIGIIEQPTGGIIVTEIIVRAIPKLDTAAIAGRLRKELVNYELKGDRDLDTIAQTFADAFAVGKTTEAAWPRVRSQISEIDRRYTQINYSVAVSGDVSEIEPQQLFGSIKHENEIGIGVAQGTDRQIGPGAIHIVIVIGIPLFKY